MIERKKETVELWNVCECGRVLHSIHEGKRGLCSSCWFASMPKDTKSALNALISAPFKQTSLTELEKSNLVDDAISKLKRDEGK